MRWAALALILVACGCSRSGQLFPLGGKPKWTYTVKAGGTESVQTIQAVRGVPVAGIEGTELAGPTGSTYVVWKDGVLWATRLPQLRANPPLPLLIDKGGKVSQTWSGTVWHAGKAERATATLTQSGSEDHVFKGSEVKATNTIITLNCASGRTIELNTWYLPYIGPISQTQRTNGRFDISMEYLSGP